MAKKPRSLFRRILRPCSKYVFKSFKKLERWGDRITGRVGPFFVGVAVVLISLCAITFFDVVYPYHFLQPDTSWWYFLLGSFWCFYDVLMFSFHYYKALTVPPGSPLSPPSHLAPSPSSSPNSLLSYLPTPSTLSQFVPSALCIGPLKLSLTKKSRGKERDERWKRSRVRELEKARERLVQESQQEEEESESGVATGGGGGGGGEGEGKGKGKGKRKARNSRSCKKCPRTSQGTQPPKPERTHHCSVCKTCILKFDHHCPWINACVGLSNERYFLLFLTYFSLGCLSVALLGIQPLFTKGLDFSKNSWEHRMPRTMLLLLWVLGLAMGVAVGVMAVFQFWLIVLGETAVESHDNEWYRKAAAHRHKIYKNPYHLGWRANLQEFFNVGKRGRYHWITIFLPLSIPPLSDGWNWNKRKDWELFKADGDDELTDEEEGSAPESEGEDN